MIHLAAKFTSSLYRGDKYFCNCCNKSFSKFKPFGKSQRSNALCPYCLSLERTRVLKFYFDEEIVDKYPDPVILHFAPERCLLPHFKRLSKQYVSADISDQVADTIVDITNIQYGNDSFDIVICSHVLAHVDDESKAIDEMIRVLRPNGQAIIITTVFDQDTTYEDMSAATPALKLSMLGQDDIWRKHGRDFISRLQRSHVVVSELDYRNKLDLEKVAKYALGQSTREILYIIDKK